MSARIPTILTGVMSSWPAFAAPASADEPDRRWNNLAYLQRMCGRRTVPVEVGQHYLHDEWKQALMTVEEFIAQQRMMEAGAQSHAETGADDAASVRSSPPLGYLAQHRLFDQVPALRRDILVPDYCALSSGGDGDENGDTAPSPPEILAWFGPAGTVSPLHHDPTHNLLAQLVGSKYVRLYGEEHTHALYPREGSMTNTSQIDAEHIDAARFPLAARLPYWEGVLQGTSPCHGVPLDAHSMIAAQLCVLWFLVCVCVLSW